jgi:L-proline amide hydrolase
MEDREGRIAFEVDGGGAETWYRIVGDLGPDGPAPLVTLHGGPGASHDYMLPLTDLARDRAVVFYDQIGNGRSTHYPGRGADFWTVELFLRELSNLVENLGIADRHHVLGSSWGGFLAQEYTLTHPPGLRSTILADTACSHQDFISEANRLRTELPKEVQETLKRHEEAGTIDDPEYEEACMAFYKRHLCRLDPWPQELVESFAWFERDPTVSETLNGRGFNGVGSFKDWTVKDRLGEIAVPVLLVSGRYDEMTPALQETMKAQIPNCEWTLFEESSHVPHIEERERYMQVVGDWLSRHD